MWSVAVESAGRSGPLLGGESRNAGNVDEDGEGFPAPACVRPIKSATCAAEAEAEAESEKAGQVRRVPPRPAQSCPYVRICQTTINPTITRSAPKTASAIFAGL